MEIVDVFVVNKADCPGAGEAMRGVPAHHGVERSALGRLAAALSLLVAPALSAQQQPPPIQLDTIRVDVASRTQSAFPARSRVVQVLTAEDLRALPVRTVAEALQWMTAADLQPRSPAQADLSLRGSTFEQVLVLVDGVRMSDPQTGHFDLDLSVPLDRVARIEVLEGPASALYGSDALGGVVNVVTREGGSGGSASVQRGTFGTWRAGASLDGVLSGVQAAASGAWDRSDGHRSGTDFKTLQLDGRLSAPTGRGRLFARAGHGRRDFGAAGFYAPSPPYFAYEETRTTTVSVGWSGEVGGGFTLHPLLSLRRHDDDFILKRTDPGFYENVHVSRQRGGELLLRRRSVNGLALALGGELYRDDLESNNVAKHVPALGDRSEDRRAAFAELAWGGARASLSAGLRGDWHEGFGSAWSPSLSASGDLTPSLRIRGAWGRSFRAPTWTERYYQDPASIGDPNLNPERSWSAEVGTDLGLPRAGVVRVTAFHRQSDDLIDWVKPTNSPVSTPSTVRNFESATYRGLEVSLEGLELAGFRFEAGGSLLSLTTTAEGLSSRYALRPLVERALVGATRSLLARQLLVSVRMLRERRRQGDPYKLVGARARIRLPKGELDLNGTNLTDEKHLDITGSPAAGRAWSVGYRLALGGGG